MAEPLAVIDQPEAAHAALSPLRQRILREMDEPRSATEVAGRLGLARQKVAYHFGVLARHGVIELAEQRRRRGLVERVFRRAATVVLAPDLLARDERSRNALVAAASDAIRAAGRPQPTATLVTDVTFATPGDVTAFLEQVAAIAASYDRGSDGDGRRMRISVLSHSVQGAAP